MVFRTAFGFPLYLIPVLLLSTAGLIHSSVELQRFGRVIFGCVLAATCVAGTVYFMLSTKYRVQDGVLHVRMGPFSRRIAIDSIMSVTDHGIAPGRVYGLGSDIIGIAYEGGAIDITPKDAEGLLAAIGFASPVSADAEAPASSAGS